MLIDWNEVGPTISRAEVTSFVCVCQNSSLKPDNIALYSLHSVVFGNHLLTYNDFNLISLLCSGFKHFFLLLFEWMIHDWRFFDLNMISVSNCHDKFDVYFWISFRLLICVKIQNCIFLIIFHYLSFYASSSLFIIRFYCCCHASDCEVQRIGSLWTLRSYLFPRKFWGRGQLY